MSLLSGKKLLLLGFVLVLLIAVPLTVYLVQQQQQTTSDAIKSTTLSFTPAAQSTTVDGEVSFDVTVDPGQNQVSFVKVILDYDSTKIATSGSGFVPNTTAFPSVLQGPIYGPGTISVTLSIGGSPQNIIQATTKVGTVTFKAIGTTDTSPTQITFGNSTQVLSIASTDQFNEDVLSTTNPASITITGPTTTATPTLEPTVEPTVTTQPTPTDEAEPTATLTPTVTDDPNASPTATVANSIPVCESLVLGSEASGSAPFSMQFTLTGSDSDGTISKATFNYGDGTAVEEIVDTGGVGTASVSIQTNHTYQTGGTFQASATLTDDLGGVSETINCTQTIAVDGTVTMTSTPTPTIPPSGPSTGILAMGAIGLLVSIIGIILLLAL